VKKIANYYLLLLWNEDRGGEEAKERIQKICFAKLKGVPVRCDKKPKVEEIKTT